MAMVGIATLRDLATTSKAHTEEQDILLYFQYAGKARSPARGGAHQRKAELSNASGARDSAGLLVRPCALDRHTAATAAMAWRAYSLCLLCPKHTFVQSSAEVASAHGDIARHVYT